MPYDSGPVRNRDNWVREYAPLVKRIAHHMMARLPASVELDDIIQAGMMGLLDAINRFEENRGARFDTYAAQRIRGAILDELREHDWLPRGVRRDMRRIEKAIRSLEQRHGRAATEPEVARELEISLEQYQQLLQNARGCQIFHFEDLVDTDDGQFLERQTVEQPDPGPLEHLLNENMREHLSAAIDRLPEREKLVMSMYYERELNLREIGAVLGVSESRVCQLHTQAIARLRSQIREQWA
ncbi:MAG TPA: RNA polymerase sigma factor FliA [Burkholderiales bacterium]|nr:RNA polymerase sigma factor FliA [Burkholderiales bacterium]